MQPRLSMMKDPDGERTYNVYYKILDASEYGLPQQRKRVFIIALKIKKKKGAFHWPLPCKRKVPMSSVLEKKVHVEERLSASTSYLTSSFLIINVIIPKDHCHPIPRRCSAGGSGRFVTLVVMPGSRYGSGLSRPGMTRVWSGIGLF